MQLGYAVIIADHSTEQYPFIQDGILEIVDDYLRVLILHDVNGIRDPLFVFAFVIFKVDLVLIRIHKLSVKNKGLRSGRLKLEPLAVAVEFY